MGDFTIVDGDTIMWMPGPYGAAIQLAPGTGKVKASAAKTKVGGKKVALVGDEMQWKSLAPVPYISGPYSIPGQAICKVQMLDASQKTKKTKVEGKPAIIKGIMFTAMLEVKVKAMMPAPPGPPQQDPVPMYVGGKGQFITTNMKVKMG